MYSTLPVEPEIPAARPIAEPLPRTRYTTRHIPRPDQFESWRDLVLPVVELVAPPDAAHGFDAEITAWDLGHIVLARANTPAGDFRRGMREFRANPIDHWCFGTAKRGSMQMRGNGRLCVNSPGEVHIKSLQGTFEGTKTANSALYAFIPRDFCRDVAASLDRADNTNVTTGLGHLLSDYLLSLERRLPMMSRDELTGILGATRAMIVACMATSPERLAEAAAPIDATLLERARETIQHNLLSSELGVDALCRELGISRSRLYRLFEPLGGVVHYIRSRRLLDAHRVLSAGQDGRSILSIAAERGFMDPADFSRAFRREFGYSPKDARQSVRFPNQPPQVRADQRTVPFGEMLMRLH